jgi:hypothetical protein
VADCCSNSACEIEKLRRGQSATLKAVLAINVAMQHSAKPTHTG